MFHDITAQAANILDSWLTAYLFGLLTIIGIAYVRLATSQGFHNQTDRIMCGVVIFQLLIAGFHCGLCLQQVLFAFLGAPNAEAYSLDQTQSTHVAQHGLYLINNIIADSVLVWRLYVVYNKNKWICIPYLIFILGVLACFIGIIFTLAGPQQLPIIFITRLGGWQETYWALSIVIQVSASSLIAYRILDIQRHAPRSMKRSKTMSVFWMILESGAILGCTTVVALSLYLAHKIAGGVVTAIGGQLAALVPASILLRVALNKVTFDSSGSTVPSAVIGFQGNGSDFTGNTGDSTLNRPQSPAIKQEVELYEYRNKIVTSVA
ncbi:hypothetical protein BDY19DRAFT_994764 [Irpex rosettiformis]|uniref:Uncharacterized protein n=1 Tax=Irpex rosettiformis TaxID=378272 RepID=A0ACB8U1C7_9APHY|nr:hypothetical protein BDY19DRAFT_994764 [Irpex rosettiformis]